MKAAAWKQAKDKGRAADKQRTKDTTGTPVATQANSLWAQEALTPTCGFSQLLEKFLVEYKSNATDLLYFGLCSCVPVNKICRNGNG